MGMQLRFLLAVTLSGAAWQAAAEVARADFVNGPVAVVAADGGRRALAKGGELNNGEMVDTGDGRAQLKFTDGALVSLQPRTEFKVDEYRFAGANDGSERGFFRLFKGAFRTVTGLIGKGKRDAYLVRTEVATIGIRGTEYGAELDNGLRVTTTGGEIEVCNQAGCTPVAAGQSAYTPNSTTKPEYTTDKVSGTPTPPPPDPKLYPEKPPVAVLTSGTGFGVVYSTYDVSSPPPIGATGHSADATATFDELGGLSGYSAASGSPVSPATGAATVHAERATDGSGIVAWGRWASGNFAGFPVSQFHYVAGVPTPASALGALTGIKATYALIGATTPTAASGALGGIVTGSLTVQFGATTNIATLLNVPIGGGSFTLSGSGITGFPTFTDSGVTLSCSPCPVGAGPGSATVNGMFFGPAASHAGMTYLFNGGGTLGDVTGAAAFRR